MAMDGPAESARTKNITCHPARYNSPITIMRTQSDTRQILSSPTVATTDRIHRWASDAVWSSSRRARSRDDAVIAKQLPDLSHHLRRRTSVGIQDSVKSGDRRYG